MEKAATRINFKHQISEDDNKYQGAALCSFEHEGINAVNLWECEAFLNELQNRIDSFESGNDPGILWDKVQAKAKKQLNNNTLR